MGKSLGNYIGVGEAPYDMFAKVMSIPDHLLSEWFSLLTDRPEDEIRHLVDPAQTDPRQAKMTLSRDIVCFYHGAEVAENAAREWENVRTHGKDPTEIPEVPFPTAELTEGRVGICRLLTGIGFTNSNNEARRLVEGGGVNLGPNRERVTDFKANVPVTDGLVVRAGKKRIARLRLK
jgi:tyrosyl-tRNA synthetase